MDEETPTALPEDSIMNRHLTQISPLDVSYNDYDDGDDNSASTDEEDTAAIQDDMRIAERTNQLMTDFRSYIHDIQENVNGNGTTTTDDAVANTDDTNHNLLDAEYGEDPSKENESLMLRTWGEGQQQQQHTTTTTRQRNKPYKDDPSYSISQGYGDIHDDIIFSHNAYNNNLARRFQYSKKKLKKCLIVTILSVIAIASIVGIVHSIHQRNVEKNLPDWEGELAEIELKEEEKNSASFEEEEKLGEPQHTEQISQNTNPQVSEGLQKPPSSSSEEDMSYYADAQGLDESGGNVPEIVQQNSNTVAQEIVEEAILEGSDSSSSSSSSSSSTIDSDPANVDAMDMYSPKWFDRETGWSGETYDQGLIFCAQQKDDVDGGFMVPCLYEAYCPQGPSNEPYGGSKSDEGGWAPILDAANDWVMIGYSDNHCKRYSEMFNEPPSWGKDGGNEENTKHIMCCRSVGSAAYADDESVEESAPAESTVAAVVVKEPTPSPISSMQEEFELASDEYTFAETYSPVWFNRNQTWEGQTWDEGDAFCKSKENARLCPYEVYCPTGPNHLPYGGVRPESTVWAPISDSRNAWVSVSGQNTCVTYMVLNLVNPSWGLTGQDNEEMTRHVMCCKDPNSAMASLSNVAVSDSSESAAASFVSDADDTASGGSISVQPTPMSEENREKLYQIIAKDYKPMAFTRDRGWSGQTYTSALMFCASQESKIPCPYELVCPLGPNGMSISGVHEGTYSPLIDAPNAYVSLETCELYSNKEPYPPIWGLTDKDIDAEDITGVVVCCDEADDRTKHVPTDDPLDDLQANLLDLFKPQWFGRDEGYVGTTYEDAETFCNRVAGMELCPADVYCPRGDNPASKTPLFPNREPFHGEQWAPYSSSDGNSYILIGQTDNNPTTTCLTHEQLYSKSPTWGGGNSELKQNILCCMKPDTMNDEKSARAELSPQWLDSSDGYEAGSYEDAVAFCKSKSLSLCPLHAYCPWGPSKPVLSGHSDVFYGEQWAPVIDNSNQWVLIGQKYDNAATTCLTHEQLEGSQPDWGTTSDNSNAKQHIMCCSLNN